MIKNILAFIVGFASSNLLLYLSRQMVAFMYPPPEGTKLNTIEELRIFHANLPTEVFLVEASSYILCAFVAGYLAVRLSNNRSFYTGLICSLMFVFMSFVIIFNYPSPIWIVLIEVFGMFLFAYFGIRLAGGKAPQLDL